MGKPVRLLSFAGDPSGALTLRLRHQNGREEELAFGPDEAAKLMLAAMAGMSKRTEPGAFVVTGLSLEGFERDDPRLEVTLRSGGRLPLSMSPTILAALYGMLARALGELGGPLPDTTHH